MSDTNNTQEQFSGDPPAEDGFEGTWDAFINHQFGADEDGGEDTAVGSDTMSGQDTVAGADSVPGNDTQSTAAPANGEAPPATSGADAIQPTPGEPTQAELAAVMGLTELPTVGADTAPAPEKPASPSGAAAEDEVFAPFQANFKLPANIKTALFEAEDPETREAALVQLLSSFGNTVLKVMDDRFNQHHAPRVQAAFADSFGQMQVRNALNGYFDSEFPELAPYQAAKSKALAIVAARDPKKPLTPELMAQVGELARKAIEMSGITLPPRKGATPAPAAAPAAPTPQTQPKRAGTPFEAGGARPSGHMEQPASNSPAALFEELSEW